MQGTKHPIPYAAAALWLCMAPTANATMGTETIMSRVDANKDKTLSLAEVRAAASKRYDLILSKNGGRVTMLQLGGRLVPADLKEIGQQTAGVASPVSKSDYLALAAKFFAKANVQRKSGEAPDEGTLNLEELGSTAGKKLVGLLE